METANMLRTYLLPIAWWFLASLAVYGEPLPGSRQFWITRPYRWSSLLGAKLLFIVAFVTFPLMLADCFILLLQGLRPWESPAGLLWHELALFVVFILPMVAVACITANFGQAILVVLAAMVPIVIFSRFLGPFWNGMSEFGTSGDSFVIGGGSDSQMGIWWPLACLVFISAALVIVFLQYRARRTGTARMIFGTAILLVLCGGKFLPDNTTFALQSPLFKPRVDTSSITAVFSPASPPPPTGPPAPPNAPQDEFTHMKLPIRFAGVPSDTTVVVELMLAEVTPAGGKPWNELIVFGQDPPDTLWHDAFVERSLIEQVKQAPVRIHLTIQLTVLGDPHTEAVPVTGGPYRVPGLGLCQSSASGIPSLFPALNCRAAFRQPAYALARFEGAKMVMPWQTRNVEGRSHYSPYPADFGINPISDSNWPVPPGATGVVFTTMQPLAHIHRELDVPNVQLAKFAN
jgi:hypothetical protein